MSDGIVIEYTQSLTHEGNSQPRENLVGSMRLTQEAFSSGWIREGFGDHPRDLLVLAAIACRARRLKSTDREQLSELHQQITGTDTNLLCSFVTNVELAGELGAAEHTVPSAIGRLADLGLIRVCDTQRRRPRAILIAPAK